MSQPVTPSGGDERPVPTEINLIRDKELRIRWRDRSECVIPLERLRAACPCATCRALRDEQSRNPLAVLPRPADAAMALAESAALTGRYALRVTWRDGHDTGIYDFALLHALGEQPGA